MSVEMDANGATERAIVQESQDNARQQCEMHRVIVGTHKSEREHLSATEEASTSGVFLALQRCQSWEINYLLLSN